MKIENVKVVSCDIDATLTWGFGGISEYNRKALMDLQDKGILVGIASGRGYEDLRTYKEKWNLDKPFDFIIGLNGSSLFDEKTGVDEKFFTIKQEYVKKIIMKIDETGLDSHIYSNGKTMFSKNSPHYQKIKDSKHRDIVVAETLEEMYACATPKILINVPDEQMPYYREVFKPILDECLGSVKLIRTSPGAMEFVPFKSNKFYALKKYCDRYDIAMENVAAFGDTTNDNEMIQGAGIGVCLLNGTDDTKKLADYITEYEAKDDGFARFVYEYIL
ncbi:MAG: HAD-IIB family hydrolase [Erysipelotrichaceae bacterium]|nr:HAD-IIB family hydrolase [Erysipelotrichaceae bacterium]